ncbi:hypothetical protein BLOT_003264 [Blomia tropicalis]|nr:hypothetical protein BLOT_003264 [Blomia tropicalis]
MKFNSQLTKRLQLDIEKDGTAKFVSFYRHISNGNVNDHCCIESDIRLSSISIPYRSVKWATYCASLDFSTPINLHDELLHRATSEWMANKQLCSPLCFSASIGVHETPFIDNGNVPPPPPSLKR